MKSKRRQLLTVNIVTLLAMCFTCIFSCDVFARTNEETHIQSLAAQSDQVHYLSDLECTKCEVGYGTMQKDQINGDIITLRLGGEVTEFEKGIFAHANSELIYDLRSLDYDYFTSYIGIDSRQGNNGDGVKFYIYTSKNGIDWDVRMESEVLKGKDAAQLVDIHISDEQYLKLVVDQLENNGNDHSVYADARLIKEEYFDSNIKRISEYDEEIKNLYENNTELSQYELTLLQREFVSDIGYTTLQDFVKESYENQDTVNWLMNDVDHLRLYIMGGEPNGSYQNSLRILSQLLNTYEADLQDAAHKDLYQKMIISLSLSHSRTVRFWMNDGILQGDTIVKNNIADSPNQSNAVDRYKIMKEMYLNNKFDNAMFEQLEIEEMRYIMGTELGDGEIKWLRDISEERNSKDPYAFIDYSATMVVNGWREDYYSEENRQKWDEKYHLTEYGIGYEKYIPHLWTVFEEDGVCWHIANLGANIESVYGVPNTLVGQPGHSAYFIYDVNNEGKGTWSLYNDVSGWAKTNDAGYSEPSTYYTVRWINGWGNGDYASEFAGSYILLGQAAINDFVHYQQASEWVLLANTYHGNYEKQEQLYRQALDVQNINFDAWLGLVNVYIHDETKTEEDLYQLEEEIAQALTYYPLPMHDLLNLIKENLTDSAYQLKHSVLLSGTLEQASVATENETIQPKEVRDVANYLLQNEDSEIATFSFDGEQAGILSLGERFEGNNVRWDYSLDNGVTWTQTSQHAVALTDAELAAITDTNDIKVHIIGVDYAEENIYTIEIETGQLPNQLYANDLENRMIAIVSSMEWRKSDTDAWMAFADIQPDLSGDTSVKVRVGAHGIYLPSAEAVYTFHADAQEESEQYVPITHLSVHEVSSQQENTGEGAVNALDGNANTIWHTAYNGADSQHHMSIKLDRTIYLSALQYVPRNDSSNGRAKNVEVYVSMDGTSWDLAGTATDWANNGETKSIHFDEAKQANYVKFVITKNYGSGAFGSASMINLFEDVTKQEGPIADIAYDYHELTNGNVTATLINPSTGITITNNHGSDTYVFTENGSFTFEFEDHNGVKGTATATVTWIDKVAPIAHVEYDINSLTNQSVTATVVFEEENIIVENNGGQTSYTFDKNGTFTFICKDAAGNETKAVAEVTWIDKTAPITSIEYSTLEETKDSVTATLISNKDIIILNNNGLNTYTFTENGTFEFQYRDQAGNTGSILAKVDWITPSENPNPPIDPDQPDTPNLPEKPDQPVLTPVDQIKNNDHTVSIQGSGLYSNLKLITEYFTVQEANEVLNNIKDSAFPLNYTVEKLLDFYLLKEDGTRFEFKDTYVVGIKLDQSLFDKELAVVYISDDGNVTYLDSWIKDQTIYFQTSHNSMYAIVSKNKLMNIKPNVTKPTESTGIKQETSILAIVETGDETLIWPLLAGIAILPLYVMYFNKRKQTKKHKNSLKNLW